MARQPDLYLGAGQFRAHGRGRTRQAGRAGDLLPRHSQALSHVGRPLSLPLHEDGPPAAGGTGMGQGDLPRHLPVALRLRAVADALYRRGGDRDGRERPQACDGAGPGLCRRLP